MFAKLLGRILGICWFMAIALTSTSQDTLKEDKTFYYRAIIGMGTGSGSFLNNSKSRMGINLEFLVEKNKTIYGFDARSLSMFNVSNMNNYMQSYDLTIGRVLKNKNFFSSFNIGVGYVEGQIWNELSDGYETTRYKTVGFPLSVKGFCIPFLYYGLGVELYANINSKSSFYGVNLCHQFGKL